MFKLIFEKELREIIGSAKFVVTFAVCALLILLTFYVGAKNYQLSQERYDAAVAANYRKMEGITDWRMVNSHRIFLPPQPLQALVTGISNDIGRTVEMASRGELSANDSRFSDDPIFAIFRFLDLDFIFQIILSLFAILFAYDAINGEKERGTLRLTFANAVPRHQYILGKVIGYFVALGVPLLIPILLGCLLLPILNVQLTSDEWARLGLIIMMGLLYFGVFLTLSVFVSCTTTRSSNSFLVLLVTWIFVTMIIPRTAVLLAGRAVDVPAVDELAFQKSRQRSQLWQDDLKKMGSFKATNTENSGEMHKEFMRFMQNLSDERNSAMEELAKRLNEDRRNRQSVQEKLAFGFARLSPTATLSLAITNLVGTSLAVKNHFLDEAAKYQKSYGKFMLEKTGMSMGGHMIVVKQRSDEEEEQAINARELPPFNYKQVPLKETMSSVIFDIGLLAFFNIVFFLGAFVRFLRYDLR